MAAATTTAAQAAATTSSSSAPAATTDPVQSIVHDLESPTFILPILIMLITFIGLAIFACVYNCCNKAAVRRRYVQYQKPNEKGWIPEIHVPVQFKLERAQEASMYRFS